MPKTGVDRAIHSGKYGEYVAKYASGFTPSTVIRVAAGGGTQAERRIEGVTPLSILRMAGNA